MLISCPNEKEVRDLIANGQWPDACPPELRAHVSACRACGDLVLVSAAFQQARAQSLAAAPTISPALLLWRAQLRRRNAALERISRPLLGAQIFAFVSALAAVAGFAGFEARRGVDWLAWSFWREWFVSAAHAYTLSSAAAGAGWNWVVLTSIVAAFALLGGAAVYLATDKQ
jgi:hypothetical protein